MNFEVHRIIMSRWNCDGERERELSTVHCSCVWLGVETPNAGLLTGRRGFLIAFTSPCVYVCTLQYSVVLYCGEGGGGGGDRRRGRSTFWLPNENQGAGRLQWPLVKGLFAGWHDGGGGGGGGWCVCAVIHTHKRGPPPTHDRRYHHHATHNNTNTLKRYTQRKRERESTIDSILQHNKEHKFEKKNI